MPQFSSVERSRTGPREIPRDVSPQQAASNEAHSELLSLLKKIERHQTEHPPSPDFVQKLDALYKEARYEQQKISLYTKDQAKALREQADRMRGLPNYVGLDDLLATIDAKADNQIQDMGDVPESLHRGVNFAQGLSLSMGITPLIASGVGLPAAIVASMALGGGSVFLQNKLTKLSEKIPLIGRLPEHARRFGITGGLLAGSLAATAAIGGTAALLTALPLVGIVGGATALMTWLQRSTNRQQLEENIRKADAMRTTAASRQPRPRQNADEPQFTMAA